MRRRRELKCLGACELNLAGRYAACAELVLQLSYVNGIDAAICPASGYHVQAQSLASARSSRGAGSGNSQLTACVGYKPL
jgi:hypothetical protein